MTLRNEPAVEPLSEAAWQRIEASIFEERARPDAAGARARPVAAARRRIFAVAILPLAAAAAVLFSKWPTAHQGEAATFRLVAREHATETRLGDVSVQLEPRSVLVGAAHASAHTQLAIESGAALFSVAPRGQGPAFVVRAGDVRVEVVGTRFRVERVGESARVAAYEGVVRVVAAGTSSLLHAGETWPQAAQSARDRELSGTEAAPDRDSTEQGPVASPPARSPLASRPSRRSPHAARAEPNERSRVAFEQATLLETSDPERALRIYRKLSREPGAWGANALCAMARLELERGHPAKAASLLESYIERFPQGDNASDARLLIEQLANRRQHP